MLNPFHNSIESLAFLYAHRGYRMDEGNCFYSVAAAVIKPGNPKETFESLVRYPFFRGRERLRSNLSQKQLDSAPEITVVSRKFREFLKGSSFILTLNQMEDFQYLGAFSGVERIVDLNLAAQFFLPGLPSLSFKGLREYFSGKRRRKNSFDASELVELSIALLKYICGVRLNDRSFPRASSLRYFLKKSDTLFGSAFLHTAQNYSRYFGGLINPCSLPDTENWQQFLGKVVSGNSEKPDPQPFQKISQAEISDRYRALSTNETGFQFRPSQVAFAECVTEAINKNTILCLEAGTGTGKTLGYLIPVLDFLVKNPDARVAISTYTKNLQEQVFQKEVSYAKEQFKLYRDIPTAVLKGKSSYLCAGKLDYLMDEHVSGVQRLAWLYLVNLCYHFETADVDSMGDLVRHYFNGDGFLSHALRSASAREGCPPSHRNCPAQILTARARDSRLVITNHHKLALLDRDPILGGLFRNYLIDEANHFEHAVRNAFREEIASRDVMFSLSYLEKIGDRLSQKAAGENLRLLEEFKTNISRVYHEFSRLHSGLALLCPPGGAGNERLLPSQHSNFDDGHIIHHFRKIRAAAIRVKDVLKSILDDDRRRMLKIQPRTLGRMKNEILFLGTFIEELSLFENAFNVQNRVQTFRVFRKHFVLASAAVEANVLIRDRIYQNRDWVIYTAATLRYRDSFDAFKMIAGLNKPVETKGENRSLMFKVIPSPFEPQNMEIMIPDDAVSGSYGTKERWLNYIVRVIPMLIQENKGRTLVLFASYSDLNHVAEKVSEQISNAMLPLLIQKPGQSTIHLCDDFISVKESVLFGVDTFWHGVDFKGDTLTQVIITRTPFPSPLDALQIARKSLLPLREYFKRYYYDTETKLKQGVGRLIRSHTDRGRVVILDSRSFAREYADRHAAVIKADGGLSRETEKHGEPEENLEDGIFLNLKSVEAVEEGVGLELERTTIEMVCLANSRKHSGRCVAGKILGHGFSGAWVRPVSSRSTGELSRSEINLQQGFSPQLLDIISLQLVNPVSHPYQSENWLNDAKTSWKKVGKLPVEKLTELCDNPNALWVNGYHSYNGMNDRFPVEMADELLGGSLRLVKPEKPVLWVGQELHGKIKVRCRFSCNGETYSLVVTDPVVETKYLAMENGEYPLTSNNACLCVSVGEPHQGFCYKLVAGVIGLEGEKP